MEKVTAIVVTFNRKQLLKECIDAILTQTRKPDSLIIIDNASTDGTEDFIKSSYSDYSLLHYKKLTKNSGGSGGFYEGFKEATKNDTDWLWIMDDDTIPCPECLENLISDKNKLKVQPSFLASSIYGPNGEFMNVPGINLTASSSGYPYWYEELANGMINIRNATFVSLLINAKAVEKCGYPCKDYFLWGDDTEYTQRIIKYFGPAYMSGKSKAVHKRSNCKALKIYNETDTGRIRMFRYFYRNTSINNLFYCGKVKQIKFTIRQMIFSFTMLFSKRGWLKFHTIQKGLWEGLLSGKKTCRYINTQLDENRKDER